MDPTVARRCNIEEIENPQPEEAYELLPCEKKIKLKPEDEISLDSIISSLLPRCEPSYVQFRNLKWDLVTMDFHNEKQSMLFEDKLYISQLRDDDCSLSEESKIFMERELDEIGEFHFRVEESYDGFVVFAKSNMVKDKAKFSCGHWLRGKYNDKLNLICEKRSEYDYVDNARVERTLDARIIDDKLIAKRESKINSDTQRFKAVINVKGRDDVFLLDGGVTLLMRYLIINNFRGDFHYFTMNLFGKVLRCLLTVHEERKCIKMFHRTFPNAIRIANIQYFNDYPQEVSETYYSANGKIILHFWHGFRYILHETKGFIAPKEPVLPKLELIWRNQNQLLNQYRLKKKLNYANVMAYVDKHPELADFLMDFILNVLKHKPQNVLEFTVKFFQKFRKPLPAT